MSAPNALFRQFDDAAQIYGEVQPYYFEDIVEHIATFVSLLAEGRVFDEAIFTGAHTLIHQVSKHRSNATRAYFSIRPQSLF